MKNKGPNAENSGGQAQVESLDLVDQIAYLIGKSADHSITMTDEEAGQLVSQIRELRAATTNGVQKELDVETAREYVQLFVDMVATISDMNRTIDQMFGTLIQYSEDIPDDVKVELSGLATTQLTLARRMNMLTMDVPFRIATAAFTPKSLIADLCPEKPATEACEKPKCCGGECHTQPAEQSEQQTETVLPAHNPMGVTGEQLKQDGAGWRFLTPGELPGPQVRFTLAQWWDEKEKEWKPCRNLSCPFHPKQTYRTISPLPGTDFPAPPAGEQWHNPDNVSYTQLLESSESGEGGANGSGPWRLLLVSELKPLKNKACQFWFPERNGWFACRVYPDSEESFRTRAPLPGNQEPVGSAPASPASLHDLSNITLEQLTDGVVNRAIPLCGISCEQDAKFGTGPWRLLTVDEVEALRKAEDQNNFMTQWWDEDDHNWNLGAPCNSSSTTLRTRLTTEEVQAFVNASK